MSTHLQYFSTAIITAYEGPDPITINLLIFIEKNFKFQMSKSLNKIGFA